MKQTYTFFEGGPVEFDDEKTVRELIAYAFDQFDFYEPLGMDTVTLFQAHHPDTDDGWFTTDTGRTCAQEIKNPHDLFFGYHIPNVLYYAEGGWGHHMPRLGNHPHIPNAVPLTLQFEESDHTMVINGDYRLSDIISIFRNAEYIPQTCDRIRIIPIGCADRSYSIPFSDPLVRLPLADLPAAIAQYHARYIQPARGDYIVSEILQFR